MARFGREGTERREYVTNREGERRERESKNTSLRKGLLQRRNAIGARRKRKVRAVTHREECHRASKSVSVSGEISERSANGQKRSSVEGGVSKFDESLRCGRMI